MHLTILSPPPPPLPLPGLLEELVGIWLFEKSNSPPTGEHLVVKSPCLALKCTLGNWLILEILSWKLSLKILSDQCPIIGEKIPVKIPHKSPSKPRRGVVGLNIDRCIIHQKTALDLYILAACSLDRGGL